MNTYVFKNNFLMVIIDIGTESFLFNSKRYDAIQHYICKNHLDKKEIKEVYHYSKSKVKAITINHIRVLMNINYHM